MGVYLGAKFEVFSIILTGFRQGVILPPPSPATSTGTPKKPIQIRVKDFYAWKLFLKKTIHQENIWL